MTWTDITKRFPDATGPPNAGTSFRHASDGEGFDALCRRVGEALDEIVGGSRNGARVLVVTHAGPLHALLRIVLGEARADAMRIRFMPASFTRFAIGRNSKLLVLNQTVEPVRMA